ncbi:DNA-binding protein [Erysipelothrix larvae]|uniref:DNA-binding protein n=1 Tax=Erysipelothrix larvae TaxID=1514105 RepID=A0A0X8GZ66_9FIRM|nr:PPC domain-containing DNA-binding protein [Erysipelothrix larvae]AMC93111.1 DNA-binding protein [Erysipelothrix larvae]
MKEHVIRLMPGDDLIGALENYCQKYEIEAAYIGTCVGSLSQVRFRKGHSKTVNTIIGPLEIVSCVGTLSKGGNHIHASVSDEDFYVRGGHLVQGCIVQSTAEIVLVQLENYELSRSKDVSGYKTLIINELQKS